MLVGILSDTHGRHLAARTAIKLFADHGVKHVIHCGDVGGIEVFGELLALPCTFVWGNTDEPESHVYAYLEGVGLRPPSEVPTRLALGGKTFAVYHGHELGFDSAALTLHVDYLLHGHTHIARDERIHNTRVINPGALHRARRKTVAILNTDTDELVFHELDAA